VVNPYTLAEIAHISDSDIVITRQVLHPPMSDSGESAATLYFTVEAEAEEVVVLIDTVTINTGSRAIYNYQFVYDPADTVVPELSPGRIFIGDGCCLARGDINHDGQIDIEDLVGESGDASLVGYMFLGGPEPVCMEESDVNADCSPAIDISDLIYLVEYMFLNGPEPAPCGRCTRATKPVPAP